MSTQSVDIYGVADYLGLSLATLRRKIKAGTFPPPDAHENEVDWWEITTLDRYTRALKRKSQAKSKRGPSK